ncbi:carboxypeptidase B-like [Actinia tenebrosa]|uniref:Carboxypeptidase B-like n=1 Tax=Actinia tenebrosa TaxID=6105 RepID=A0A6P8J2W6_ACTTE|nr:carboxypeptidase B-like [Actinia tenebrosa]
MARAIDHLIISTAIVLMISQAAVGRRKTYYGDRVLRVTPKTEAALKFLNGLVEDDQNYELDFWTFPSFIARPVDVHVSRSKCKQFERLLQQNNVPFKVRLRNLQRLVNMEGMRLRSGRNFDSSFHSYQQIESEMRRLSQLHNNTIARVSSIGKTYEGRHIYLIQISANQTKNKPILFLNCGIHSREWISISTCMYLARRLVNNYERDSQIRKLIEKLEWIILPIINVDGYLYTRNRDRMWRKNKSPSVDGCMGADLNRNFNHNWGGVGSAPNKPCSPIYPGPRAFSEVETRNVAKFLYSRRKRIRGYVDFHSYGQLWMSPWGYKRQFPPNYRKQASAMNRVVKAIKHVHGTEFTYGPSSIMIYPTSGDATDWTFGVLGVTHSYGVELRPSLMDLYGFVLPPSFIAPVGKETFQGLKALAEVL